MSNEHKALIRRYVGEYIGKGDLSLMDELLLPSYALHMNADNFDLQSHKQFQPSVLAAFPDGRWVIGDMVAEGDRVAWRYSFYGTHLGEFMGLPATGDGGTRRRYAQYPATVPWSDVVLGEFVNCRALRSASRVYDGGVDDIP